MLLGIRRRHRIIAKESGPFRRCASTTAVLVLSAIGSEPARAQWGAWQADSLLASGQVAAAESSYYATSSSNPRNAAARAALGRYLAARGALRIGAVLLEEARLFGGDTTMIARALVPIYRSLGDWRSLAVLPKSPLSLAEGKRVRWLVARQPVLEFPDSIATVAYRPLGDGTGLGAVSVRVDDEPVDAVIDPRVTGLVLRGRAARRKPGVHMFGSDSSGVVAVANELHIGGVTLSNVPTRIDTTTSSPRVRSGAKRRDVASLIGLDVLRALAPTFDAMDSTLILRRTGQIAQATPGTRIPILLDENGLRLLVNGHWDTAASHRTALMLATRRWTLDMRRGEAVLQ